MIEFRPDLASFARRALIGSTIMFVLGAIVIGCGFAFGGSRAGVVSVLVVLVVFVTIAVLGYANARSNVIRVGHGRIEYDSLMTRRRVLDLEGATATTVTMVIGPANEQLELLIDGPHAERPLRFNGAVWNPQRFNDVLEACGLYSHHAGSMDPRDFLARNERAKTWPERRPGLALSVFGLGIFAYIAALTALFIALT